jgi:succinate-semialdehyde dehydrogenase/glutarate-semialdehyde dehydrogenase
VCEPHLRAGHVYDAFAQKLSAAVGKPSPMNGLEPGASQGPLIDDHAVLKVEEHIEDATRKSAKVVVGGKRHERGGLLPANGARRREVVDDGRARGDLRGRSRRCSASRPKSKRSRWPTTPSSICRVFLRPRHRPRVARGRSIESGMVGINTGLISTEVAPFGGVKESGLGREGSKYGIDEFLEIKYLSLGGIC